MTDLLEHINQDIKRRQSKDKDLTVHKTEYWSKTNPTVKFIINNALKCTVTHLPVNQAIQLIYQRVPKQFCVATHYCIANKKSDKRRIKMTC